MLTDYETIRTEVYNADLPSRVLESKIPNLLRRLRVLWKNGEPPVPFSSLQI